MKKVIAWIRKHEYQWEREDYKKACNFFLLSMTISAVGLIITMVLFEQFEWNENNRLLALMLWYFLLGITFAGGWTIKWADMKLKKTHKALGGNKQWNKVQH